MHIYLPLLLLPDTVGGEESRKRSKTTSDPLFHPSRNTGDDDPDRAVAAPASSSPPPPHTETGVTGNNTPLQPVPLLHHPHPPPPGFPSPDNPPHLRTRLRRATCPPHCFAPPPPPSFSAHTSSVAWWARRQWEGTATPWRWALTISPLLFPPRCPVSARRASWGLCVRCSWSPSGTRSGLFHPRD